MTLELLGGKGDQVRVERGWWVGDFLTYAWPVRLGEFEIAAILIEKNYMRAFAPVLSLGATPPLQSRRRRR